MTVLGAILFGAFFVVAGVILIYGSYRRWSWLVDPPEEMWPFYSQALLKKFIGTEGVVMATYVMGVLFIVVAAVITAANVWRAVATGGS